MILDFNKRVMDNPDRLKTALDGKIVLMTSNNRYFKDGVKKDYPDDSFQPIEADGTPMIPAALLSLVSGKEFKSGNAEYFLAKETLEDTLGKKVTWDNRGAIIIADSYVDVQPDHYVDRHIQWNEADLIYRYMQFDNPSGYQMTDALISNFPHQKHPRLMLLNEDIKYINAHKNSDDCWKHAYDYLIRKADAHTASDYTRWYEADPGTRQLAAVEIQYSLVDIAWAYLLTDDEKYAAKSVEILQGLCSWDSVNYDVANLICGHWCQSVAMAYDTFYSYIKRLPNGDAIINDTKQSVRRLIFDDHIAAYSGDAKEPHYITMQDNFSGVCGGGLMSLLIAFCDEEDMRDECSFLLENCLRTLEMSVCLYAPDGGYYESVGYSQYMLRNIVPALIAMKNTFGTCYGLTSACGFNKAGYPFVYLQSIDYSVNYHDSDKGFVHDSLRDGLAYILGDKKLAAFTRRQQLSGEHFIDIYSQFWNTKTMNGEQISLDSEPLDAYYYGAHTGAFHSSLSDPNQTFVGFHGGRTGHPHDMLDLGEFIFESDGVIWAQDMGGDKYRLPRYFGREGYKIYRKSTQGKNCLLINPLTDSDNYWGQKIGAKAELTDLDMNKASGAMAAYDLTSAYERDVYRYVRGYLFADNRSTLTIRDELSLRGKSEIYWFMHTTQSMEVVSNTRAVLTAPDGKQCVAEVLCSEADYSLKVMEAKPFDGTPFVEGQADNAGFSKLAIHIPSCSGDVTVTVKLSPQNGGRHVPVSNTPISEWIIN